MLNDWTLDFPCLGDIDVALDEAKERLKVDREDEGEDDWDLVNTPEVIFTLARIDGITAAQAAAHLLSHSGLNVGAEFEEMNFIPRDADHLARVYCLYAVILARQSS